MSHVNLKQLVGTALVDREFCDGLLNGKRAALLAGFDLTPEEHEVVVSLQTQSVQELATCVYDWLETQQTPIASRVVFHTSHVG